METFQNLEKLLFKKQLLDFSDGLPLSGESGSPLQHLKGILDVVREIILSNNDLIDLRDIY